MAHIAGRVSPVKTKHKSPLADCAGSFASRSMKPSFAGDAGNGTLASTSPSQPARIFEFAVRGACGPELAVGLVLR